MKIVIEIGPSKVTEILGAGARRIKSGADRARKKVQSGFSRIRAAGSVLVGKSQNAAGDIVPTE